MTARASSVAASDGALASGQRVLLLTDPLMEGHAVAGHPERPERLAAAVRGVRAGAADAGALLTERKPRPVSDELLARVHDPAYVRALDLLVTAGGGWIDADTYLSPGSMIAARLAAGATVEAALAVNRGEAEVAFAVVRPPGHHAARRRAAGFCLLNNVALAAEALRSSGVDRVAIVDWDVHHGDGTQELFDADPAVLYASTHQSPFYPGTGDVQERGTGAGEGSMHNRPLAPGSGDAAFQAAWREELLPATEAFAPGAIIVSAGYDGHRDDLLAHLTITEAGYRNVATGLGSSAARVGLSGVALALEGGYDLDALAASVAATVVGILAGLASESRSDPPDEE
jgi:acetoin utilization deacetylase AcuC-like enzyme